MKIGWAWAAALAMVWVGGVHAQKKEISGAESESIQNGRSIFRVQCAYCHGIDADGGFRAPSLVSGRLSHGDSNEAMLNHILHGIPGTAMPANDIDEGSAKDVIAYLRSRSTKIAPPAGNVESGRKLFFGEGYCSRCHMVEGRGGRLGPDLTRVGTSRPPKYLAESIRDPDADITERYLAIDFGTAAPSYELVTVTTKQGASYSGVILNEDSFSVQFLDDNENIHAWMRNELKGIVHEGRSPMPKYGREQISDQQLGDLVAYLSSLRGGAQ